jgi:N-acetylglucosaminyl-diphospho-decaprenol L-rhamnosyltransferase
MADLSAVVVTYSPGDTLATFLDSLEQASAQTVAVVLADNGSTDGSVELAAKRPGVELVATGSNLGYGAAANIGVAHTDTPFVVVANPDLIWTPGALDELLATAARYPGAGAFGPLIETPEGAIYPSARALPSLGRGIGHAVFGWWWPANPWTASYRHERGTPTEGATGWLSGSCLLLRRAAFDAIGGFDPGYFMYFEDVDLGDRLAQAGWPSIYVPSALVVHAGGHATERSRDRMTVAHHQSAYRYLSGRYAGVRWAPVRVVLRAGLWARSRLARRVVGVAEGAAPQRHADDRGIPIG